MANINGVDKNAALIKQVQDKVDTILRTSEKMEEDLVTIHQGKKVLTDELEKYTKILYAQARLIEGLPIENPTEISNLVCDIISNE